MATAELEQTQDDPAEAKATIGLIWHQVHFSSGIWTTFDFASDLVPPAFVTVAFRHLTNCLWDEVGMLIWTIANTYYILYLQLH